MTTTARDAKWNAKIREQRRLQRVRRSARLMARARDIMATLIDKLGGECVECGERGLSAPLSLDHVRGITWEHTRLNYYYRAQKYLAEHLAGVPLRVLCVPCNSSRGRPSYYGTAPF